MTAESRLQLIIDLKNKLFNTKLADTQDKFNKATNNLMGKAKQLKIENAKAFGAMTDQFPALQRGMDLLTNKYVLMAGAAAGIGALAGKALKLGIDQEMQQTRFEVMLDGKEAAKKLMGDIGNIAKNSTYSKSALSETAVDMLNYGVAQEKVIPVMKQIGNVALGNEDKMKSLAFAFSQVSSAGKLQGQDFLQLVNAGFNPLREMAKQTGISYTELKEKMTQGMITSEMVEASFKSASESLGDIGPKLANTLGGKIQQLMNKFTEMLLELDKVLRPIVIPAIDALSRVIDGVVPTFQALIKGFQDGNLWLWGVTYAVGAIVGAIAAYNAIAYLAAIRTAWLNKETKLQVFWDKVMKVGSTAKTGALLAYNAVMLVATTLTDRHKMATMASTAWNWLSVTATSAWTGAQWLLNAALTANPIGIIIVAIGALVGLVAVAIKKYDSWGATLLMLIGPFGMIVNAVMTFKRNWASITKAFKEGGILAGLKRIGAVLLDVLLYPMQQLLQLLSKIPGMGGLASKGADSLANMRKKLGVADPQSEVKKKVQVKAKTEGDKKVVQLKTSSKTKKDDNSVYADLLGDGKGGKGDKKDKGTNQREQISKVTGAGQQVKNFTVNIDSFVKGGINTANTTMQKMDAKELENWFNEMLLRAVRNLELS